MSSGFPIENGLKHGDDLLPQLINFGSEYGIRKVSKANLKLDMNDTHQVLDCADDVNLIADYIRTIGKKSRYVVILSRINPTPHIDTYFLKIHTNIVFPSTPRPP